MHGHAGQSCSCHKSNTTYKAQAQECVQARPLQQAPEGWCTYGWGMTHPWTQPSLSRRASATRPGRAFCSAAELLLYVPAAYPTAEGLGSGILGAGAFGVLSPNDTACLADLGHGKVTCAAVACSATGAVCSADFEYNCLAVLRDMTAGLPQSLTFALVWGTTFSMLSAQVRCQEP